MDNQRILSEIVVQVLGFAIVFLILRKFAWGSILGMVDKRRKKIKDEFRAIEEQKKNLETLEKDYRGRLDHIETEARAKIQEASNAGQALARDIQEKARQESQKMIERAKQEITHDLAQAKLSIRHEIVEVSSLMTEKILREKLDKDGQQKIIDQFLKEMETMK